MAKQGCRIARGHGDVVVNPKLLRKSVKQPSNATPGMRLIQV